MSVVVGWVPTEAGRAALQHAAREAELRSTDLVVLGTAPGSKDEAELHADVELLRASTTRPVSVRPLTGDRDAADELVDLSFEESTELIVLGVRRRSPVGKLLLGSTSQRVLLEAQCPVTAVKPPLPG
ncbi:universal stress protein [Kineococcus sp. SYSU DK002]|uniref:universal stress protein n=1 Tax=Kineococcus sp. SYSU DK002 TaxID=3383123 RepID=UPI003D7DCC1D